MEKEREKKTLIEIHMIQNHSPANLNRDDQGAPKTAMFGGCQRARISSQCIKRSIRRSNAFQAALEKDGGVRTRRLITYVAENVHGAENPPPTLIEFIASVFKMGGVDTVDKKGAEEPNNTKVIFFMPKSGIDEMIKAAKAEAQLTDAAKAKLAACFAEILGRTAMVPDIALSGRMLELDRAGVFPRTRLRVEAALSVAHAVSTHEVSNEVDYFTAIDDLPGATGAAHPDEAPFASACFYKYFCLDWEQLLHNLTPPEPQDRNSPEQKEWLNEVKPKADRLAAATVGHFLVAAATTNPSGKQNSFAAQNPPDGILVEIKTNGKMPTNCGNAFADPVPQKSQRGLVGQSIAQLGQYVHDIAEGYDIKADYRFWFSPAGRYDLTWIDRKEKREYDKEKKVVDSEGGNLGSLNELVKKVVHAATGRDWDDVKDAGKEKE